ncbi:unnamed protein product [Caenorhabditis brenneri]
MLVFVLILGLLAVSSGHQTACRKLKHFEFEPVYDYDINRAAEFSHLQRHGKHYTHIKCPNDETKYALVAKHEESIVDLFTIYYTDMVVLAAGYNINYIARCDGDSVIATTTDGRTVEIEQVSCLRYDYFRNKL